MLYCLKQKNYILYRHERVYTGLFTEQTTVNVYQQSQLGTFISLVGRGWRTTNLHALCKNVQVLKRSFTIQIYTWYGELKVKHMYVFITGEQNEDIRHQCRDAELPSSHIASFSVCRLMTKWCFNQMTKHFMRYIAIKSVTIHPMAI